MIRDKELGRWRTCDSEGTQHQDKRFRKKVKLAAPHSVRLIGYFELATAVTGERGKGTYGSGPTYL